ncbi:transcription factor bHLH148 [Lotus japonicus]|uniref:transcription factor bHLH148 n=1 Tax=Lotus japonicus TaxID=34305 RepID=UPI002586D67B|nr:transcription factor bHLH148 [Lotus japonicus]
MASSLISNSPSTGGDRSRDPHRTTMKRKKKSRLNHQNQQDQSSQPAKWRSQAQQQLYSSKLRQALVRVNGGGGSGKGKAVRDAADRALAVAARGRTRWSRAILTNRIKIKFRKQQQQQRKRLLQQKPAGPGRSKKARFSVLRLKGKTLPAVQRKVRFLGRLVPGCRKEPLPVILEEAIDYIPALEMQVRAMAALADLLLGSSSSGGGSSSFPPPS